MLGCKDIYHGYGDKIILQHVSLSLSEGVTGLVGKNGVGKTTLLQILAGELTADSGIVSRESKTIGYLPQQIDFGNETVESFLEKKNKYFERYTCEQLFNTMNMSHISLSQYALSLSGGEKTKLYLASILLSEPFPSALLLDEPTNNLDLESIYWLESFLSSFSGPVLLISHDRTFLDTVADNIIELENGTLNIFGGDYTFYKQEKEHQDEVYKRMFTVQEKRIRQVEVDILSMKSKAVQGEKTFSSRNPYQRRKIRKSAQQAVARQKKLEKFLTGEEHLERPEDERRYPFSFLGEVSAQKFIVGCTSINVSIDQKIVLQDVSLQVYGKQHVWISGANGAGKSTLLGLLAGNIQPSRGRREVGSNIKIGYFSQELPFKDMTQTILDVLLGGGVTPTQAFEYAIYLHLAPEDLRKQLKYLSRGQLTKLAFILLLMEQNHVLILDEPTNHLETDTREEIEHALSHYDGAIIIASHDRYFLEQIGIDRELQLKHGGMIEV